MAQRHPPAPPSRPVQHCLRVPLQLGAAAPPRPAGHAAPPKPAASPNQASRQPQVKAEGDDKKPVKVKKEFDMPGQTRETPPEVRGAEAQRRAGL
jgi:hypothetical protein